MNVAIVCDWLTGVGGAERVVYELHKLYPDAPIYTSQYNPRKIDWFNSADIRTGWLNKLPSALKKFLPLLRALYFSRLDLNNYDLVISSAGAEAKGVKTKSSTIHVSYIHSPTHYYWIRFEEYMKSPGFGFFDPLARLGLKLLVKPMKRWDYKAAQRPDYIIANSNYTKNNIQKYYNREAIVIHPPVEIERFSHIPSGQQRSGFVVAGRQTPYKKIDLAVQACTEMNQHLTVIGDGPDHKKLVAMAGKSINFQTKVTDDEMASYFASTEAFIFPNTDDFGIVAVEAMAAGTPVIAYKAGGALDYVIPGKTGEFFDEQSAGSLKATLKTFNGKDYDSAVIQKQAAMFSSDIFRGKLQQFMQKNSK
ncbi:glycosyltransferase [Candidatus Saccharibacteria bacterium]|nr:glycosyltransferase [Candidatus Saccharibacteria bacterium]